LNYIYKSIKDITSVVPEESRTQQLFITSIAIFNSGPNSVAALNKIHDSSIKCIMIQDKIVSLILPNPDYIFTKFNIHIVTT
jgi:hypothetical protein